MHFVDPLIFILHGHISHWHRQNTSTHDKL